MALAVLAVLAHVEEGDLAAVGEPRLEGVGVDASYHAVSPGRCPLGANSRYLIGQATGIVHPPTVDKLPSSHSIRALPAHTERRDDDQDPWWPAA